MDPKYQRRMFDEGGFLIIHGMPPGTEFGVDLKFWNVGEKFTGLKMIPPGIHFFYFSAINEEGQIAPRKGFFHSFKAKEIVIKRYNDIEEDLNDENDPDQIERIRHNLYNLDKSLGPYPIESWSKWISLVQYIETSHIQKLQPLSGRVCAASDLINVDPYTRESCESSSQHTSCTGSSAAQTRHSTLPELLPRPGTELRLSCIPKKSYRDGASPSEVTKYSIDSSFKLQCILDTLDSHTSLIAELQFCFMCFLVGQVWDGWEHWKSVVSIICKAEESLLEMPHLFVNIISVLHFQIHEVPEDIFVDIVEGNNFLASALSFLFANITENALALPQELVSKARKFKSHLKHKFKWDLNLETEEDAPVVVE